MNERLRNTVYFRYTTAIVALVVGFGFSIRLSERGFLFDSSATDALAATSVPEGEYDLQAMAIFNRVLLQLKDNYVEPQRVRPARMLNFTLDRVQNTVPEIVALFDDDIEGSPTTVEIRVGAHTRTFDVTGVETLWEMSFKLREIFRFVQEHTDPNEIDLRELEYAAINGMLATLDPHSVLLSPRVYEDMQTANQGEFGGLGIVISIRDNQLTVLSPIDGTPASRAGFRAGDRIVKINDESTVNMPLDEAVSRLRGLPGTQVTVEVMRSGWTEPHSFTLERERINIDSVSHQSLGDGIGYIEIRNFQANTHNDLMNAIAALEGDLGGIRGLVLDLRNNPGGLLGQAIAISDTFLSSGTIVTTVGIGDRLREENPASPSGTQSDYPIVVLVNPGSASASEIVAGALKSHNRAVLIGDTTFGKGSVQVLYQFQDGSALKLTIAKYLTPGDVSIQGVGIVPDIRTVPVNVGDRFIDLYPSEHTFREGEMETSLDNGDAEGGEEQRPEMVVKYYDEPEEIDPEAIRDPNEFEVDFEIGLARQVLLASDGASERMAMLARAATVIDQVRDVQLREVQERLRVRNVDWSVGPNVIQPLRIEVVTSPAAGRVHSGDPLSITLRATNEGTRPMYQVRAVSRSDHMLFDDREFVFGRLDPQQTVEWTVTTPVPIEEPSRYERIGFAAFADTIDLNYEAAAFVEIIGRDRPRWGFSYFIDDSDGNDDGLLQQGETVRLIMDATNTGAGAAASSVMYLRDRTDGAVFLRTGRESFDALASGERHRAEFEFEVRNVPESGHVMVEAVVYDSVFREVLSEELNIPVAAAGAVRVVSGRAVATASPLAIRGGAAHHTPEIAEADEGASLPVTAAANGFYRVEWEGGSGWVDEADVEFSDPEARPPSPVRPRIAFRPPTISLDNETVSTSDEMFELTGTISDDRTVRDYYVVLHHRISTYRTRSIKFDYQYVGSQTTDFVERIPLRLGMNRVTVFARDDDKLMSTQTMFIYRHE